MTERAPEAHFVAADGTPTTLGALLDGSSLVLVFLRHFGWTFCREQLAQLREAAPKFAERGARIAVVGQGPADKMHEFCDARGVSESMVCLADPDRSAYQAFGLGKGSLGEVMGPRVLGAGIKALRYGVGLPGTGQDVRQLGGAFVIARDGTLRLAQRAETSADRATIDQLLQAL